MIVVSEPVFTGGCFCGNVRYRATGTARNLCFCHCESCRRAAGAPYVAWGSFDRTRFHVSEGQLTLKQSSPRVSRGFCAECGTSITYTNEGRPEDIDVTLSTLDDPAILPPRAHIWVEDKLPWVSIGDDVPAYPTVPD